MADTEITLPSKPRTKNPLPPKTAESAVPAKRRALLHLKTIRARLLTMFVLVGLLPAIAITAVSTILSVQSGRQQAVDQLESVGTLKEAQLKTWVLDSQDELEKEINERSLSLIPFVLPDAGSDRLREDSASRLRAIFEDSLARSQRFEELFITDLQGTVLVSTSDNQEGATYNERPYFQKGLTGRYIEPVQYFADEHRINITLFQPVIDGEEVIAIIGARVNSAELNNIMAERAGLGKTGQTYLVDGNFALLTESRFAGYPIGSTVVRTDGVRASLTAKQDDVISYADYRGQDVFGVQIWIPELQAVLLAERTQSEALAPTFFSLAVNIGAALLAAVLAIGTGLLFMRTISRPISNLSQTATLIAGGNLALYAQVERDDEIGNLAQSFNSMTSQLRELISGLEVRVEARTRDLQIAADVSRQITTILDLDSLLPQFVERAWEDFGLYHVSVFLYNESDKLLRLEAGSGEAGQQMKKAGKAFDIDAVGLVPQAARLRQAVVANDVSQAAEHFLNPVLPDTSSEAAIPMIVGSNLVGVLDLQSIKLNRFTEDDTRVMTTLAGQLAVAVQNAYLYAEQVQVAKELSTLDAMKSQFMASMSHELRTPLNAILNFTQFVSSGLYGPVNERQVDALKKSVVSGEHLLSLINDILDITKIEAGMMELFVEDDVNLNHELKTVINMAESLTAEKAIKLVVDVDPDLPTILGDKRRIRQILVNLVSNAAKFTDMGSITISAKRETEDILFKVVDTGPGIAEKDQEMIFQSFRQTQAGLQKHSGTGLGLPIAKRLSEAHGGKLWLESTLGSGSTFFVRLPIYSEALAKTIEII
ncbi:MAG: GAF domain-containing protein [Chloroflexi bacterium]|nr:GAF domain-containing protein [Chloroflexota bacterium]